MQLKNAADRHHLRFDATTAEDVAIRWADAYFGHLPQYGSRRDECMEELFAGVANQHGVDVATVREYRLKRDVILDAVVFISFGLVYATLAYFLVGRIRRRFPPGEPGFWVMTLALSLGVAATGVMAGNFGYIIVESYRLNSGHLSYRMDRIPWRQHWPILFVCFFLVFLLVSAIRSRVRLTN